MPVALSVIVVVGQRRERAERALASLLGQELERDDAGSPRLEILLLDCAPGSPLALAGSEHPAVRTLRLDPATTFSAAKALGVRSARAPIVAFLEEHAHVAPGWAQALVVAHRGPWAGVGAEVHNGNPRLWASRVVQLMNYHLWLPPEAPVECAMLPGNNASFKRAVLLGYGERLERLLRAEIVLHTRLHRDGHRLLLEPAAKFFHLNDAGWSSCARGFFLFHRIYGPARAAEFGWGAARRALYILAAPLVPLYFMGRLLLVLGGRRPRLALSALLAAPFVLFTQLAGALGQATGLLFGAGAAEVRFTLYELNEWRDLALGGRPEAGGA